MKKCLKTTSGKHYWHSAPKEFISNGRKGIWLGGKIFVKAMRQCLTCGLIDDKKEKTK